MFAPNYEDNLLTFPYGNDRFFKEINDQREVELTFHFWGGETVKYTVTKDGEQVVGKSIKSTLPEEDHEPETPEDNNDNESGTPDENENNDDKSETPEGNEKDKPGKGEGITDTEDGNKETNEEEYYVTTVNNNNKTKPENIQGKVGEKLPETATGNYNLIITGIIILLVGGFIAFFVRKQKVQI